MIMRMMMGTLFAFSSHFPFRLYNGEEVNEMKPIIRIAKYLNDTSKLLVTLDSTKHYAIDLLPKKEKELVSFVTSKLPLKTFSLNDDTFVLNLRRRFDKDLITLNITDETTKYKIQSSITFEELDEKNIIKKIN
jgi:hypothetical protein